ncbi:hypothetical protein MLD38_028847 [Melastoma candidum]|uniref:Uncharacterized protein n=1 Tax=Melastoma candidum TaxID=119954 RepID=A0ACB9N265_9MYRT|nr:hypothetical protein MLD38_028847 [Melastoma candidum]
MDYYKVLGLTPSSTKDEVKEAFRRLAVKYHPDKHSLSSQSVRDDATLRFKQVSEAYDVLVDDRKRAEYNIRRSSGGVGGRNYYGNTGFGGGRSSGGGYGYGYGYSYHKGRSESPPRGFAYRFEIVMRYMTTRAFLLNATLASALLGAAVVIDRGWDTLWKMQNSGKSFEDAMESIEKARSQNRRR